MIIAIGHLALSGNRCITDAKRVRKRRKKKDVKLRVIAHIIILLRYGRLRCINALLLVATRRDDPEAGSRRF